MGRAEPRTWRSRAFGLEVEGSFDAPGLPRASGPVANPLTRVEIVEVERIEARWSAWAATRLTEERFDTEPDPARSIDHVAGVGYRLYARHFGLALVSEDGARVLCAPPDDEPWSWQRFLVGRVLPWAAVLRGREVFHAAAVTIDGRAAALVGQTGLGKSSLAAHLVLEGAGFLTDDVLAIDRDAGTPRAHPGAGILCVRPAERAAMGAARLHRLGRLLGESGKLYVAVARDEGPRPLGAIYFLARAPARTAVIERLERPGFRTLLGSTFIAGVQTPSRLRAQFELCAQLAASVPMFRVAAGGDRSAAAVARMVLDHASAKAGPCAA